MQNIYGRGSSLDLARWQASRPAPQFLVKKTLPQTTEMSLKTQAHKKSAQINQEPRDSLYWVYLSNVLLT